MEEKFIILEDNGRTQKRLTVSEFKGKKYFHIREYYVAENDKDFLPSKKGISFNIEKAKDIAEKIKDIDKL